MCDTLKILSMNCQGLANARKRRDIFHYLRSKDCSIYLLQDTHFNKKHESYIRAEWGYNCYFSSLSSSARGVAIMFNNNFEYKINKVYKDTGGNLLMISLNTMGKDYLFVNLYGPNKDDPQFFIDLNDRIKAISCDRIVIGGDWNLVLNFQLDYFNYKHYNNIKAQERVEIMMNELDLTDIWRELNPELKRFTWRRNRPLQQSRLDFFLVSDSLLNGHIDSDILPGYRTDHSIITISLGMKKEDSKFGLWKFNSSLLKDIQYLNEINKVIENVIEEYAVILYLREALTNMPKSDLQFTISDQLFLDTLLMKIRAQTISYASMKKKLATKKEKDLERTICTLESKRLLTETEQVELENSRAELVALRGKKMEGVLIRSKARWIADGEKITSYFCSLEKRNYINKRITKLEHNGFLLEDDKEIAKEVNNFYKTLYDEREVEDCEITELVKEIPQLSVPEHDSLEGDITLEATFSLKNMNNKKSPGSDGFSAEFFKVFWRTLGPFVVRALNEGFRKGELSTTQKEGIIICIPKGDKPKEFIKNWRPISLLNVVYKIGSTCIANRLKNVLPSLINEDQTGFMKNRYIGDNIRLVYDLINYLQAKNKPGLLICLDFEKAFDSLSWKFMFRVLKAFGCGPGFCRWIETFYNNIKSTVLVNGSPTSWFQVHRGCRQGDPISPYLFIMCVEILAIMIRENKNIKGIVIGNSENKIVQYADDTELTLEGDEPSFINAIDTIQIYGRVSGLKLNADKSCAIWLGSKKNSKTVYMPHLHMKWNPSKFKTLGIWLTSSLDECIKINYEEKFGEIQALFKIWLKRQLTPVGRVAILKSLILSKLIYLWILLPNPPIGMTNEIQASIFRFVWNNKNDRIGRKASIKNVVQGGIGIPDIRTYMNALKLTWIKKLLNSSHKWTHIIKSLHKRISLLSILGSSLCVENITNQFWKDVFKAYDTMGNKVKCENVYEIDAEPLFCNNNILVGKSPIFYADWLRENVCTIGKLLKENRSFLSYNEFVNAYGIATNFLTYSGCINAVKSFIHASGVPNADGKETKYDLSKVLRVICSVQRGTKVFYDILINNNVQPNCCKKWEERIFNRVDWNVIFKKVQSIKDVKLKWLQIRIVHRILGTNIITTKMGLENNNKCTFCQNYKENIQHLLWDCVITQNFWKTLERNIVEKCLNATALRFSEHVVLFGCDSNFRSDQTFDLLILLAKSYIYKCKMSKENPIFQVFINILKERYEIEKFMAKINMRYCEFVQAWLPYTPLFVN